MKISKYKKNGNDLSFKICDKKLETVLHTHLNRAVDKLVKKGVLPKDTQFKCDINLTFDVEPINSGVADV